MKKALVILTAFLILGTIHAQNSQSTRKPVNENEVPKNVRREFKLRYHGSFVKMWYITHISYWYQDYGLTYYNGWYPKSQSLNYFE